MITTGAEPVSGFAPDYFYLGRRAYDFRQTKGIKHISPVCTSGMCGSIRHKLWKNRREATGMIAKIWKAAQMQNLLCLQEKYNIPQEVIGTVEQLVEILDKEYGLGRDVDSDDGGYLLLLLPDSDTDDTDILYHRLLEVYGLRYGTVETESVICIYDGLEWYMELYLTTNNYGITVIYPKQEL